MITKNKIKQELRGFWNTTKEINGVKLRRRAWDNNSWQVVDNLDFNKANIIIAFYYQNELIDYIYKLNNKQK